MDQHMSDQLLYQIALTQIPGVGSITGKKLVSYCGGVEAVFRNNRKSLSRIPGVGKALIDSLSRDKAVFARAEKEIQFLESNRIKPLFYLDKQYPQRLHHCMDAPLMLYFLGDLDWNRPRIISIVGTRNATEYGKDICHELVSGLAPYGVVIVSGLAYGIDSHAHKASLEARLPTAAVLAHGLDRIYPPLNRLLARRILRQGGLLTEFMSMTNPDRENFPKRNRIIAGVTDAVVVVEAGIKGGALITADIAGSYNRDVFAIPGRLNDQYSTGCNYLIKSNKAALIQSAADVVYMMGWEQSSVNSPNRQTNLFDQLSPDEQSVAAMLELQGESTIDWLSLKSGFPLGKVTSLLLSLEFKGIVKCLPGKMYRLV
jgi:DNA processing protein